MSEDAFFTVYNLVNGIPSVKNANGKTISGSQKKARFKALASVPGWNQEGARNFVLESGKSLLCQGRRLAVYFTLDAAEIFC